MATATFARVEPTMTVALGTQVLALRVVLQKNAILRNGLFQVALVGVFHREAITREAVARILRQHVLEDFHSIRRHSSTCYYTERWHVRTFTWWPDSRRAPG